MLSVPQSAGRPAPLDERGLFAGLDRAAAILLAVSGGPDSMALMHLAARWAGRLGDRAPGLHVATVDHGLRPEARAEAELVARAARSLGLPHAILDWAGPRPTSRVQERARAARYALLAAEAARLGASILLTAHHADDQAETVMMRLARGSGVAGLAGMRRETPLRPGLTLARPLLDLPKADLVHFCVGEGLAVVTDPSNADPASERVRLRDQVAARDALGLRRDTLTRLARRMERAEVALAAETARVEAELAPTREPGVYRIRPGPGLAPEILARLLRGGIGHVRPAAPIRLDRLEALSDELRAAIEEGRPHRATLAGARIALARGGQIEITGEARRNRGRTAPAPDRETSGHAAIKAELTRPLASLGKTFGATYIA